MVFMLVRRMLILPACMSTPLQGLSILGTSLSYAAAMSLLVILLYDRDSCVRGT